MPSVSVAVVLARYYTIQIWGTTPLMRRYPFRIVSWLPSSASSALVRIFAVSFRDTTDGRRTECCKVPVPIVYP
jgi:hypothetical protein